MDHLFNVFVSRNSVSTRHSSCGAGDKPKKRVTLKRALSGNDHSNFTKNMNNSELVDSVDEQLMQIREKLAKFREQDTQLRERMNSLSDSVSELASQSSLSSFTPSECSNLGSLDEVQSCTGEDEGEENGYKHQLRTLVTNGNRPPVRSFHMRRTTSDPSSMYRHVELPEEEEMETQRYSTYSADQTFNLYPQYTHPEEISTLF